MPLPAQYKEPTTEHYLYGVWGTDGKISARCTSTEHAEPFIGPKVDKSDTALDDALRLGREEHDRVTLAAPVGSHDEALEESEEG